MKIKRDPALIRSGLALSADKPPLSDAELMTFCDSLRYYHGSQMNGFAVIIERRPIRAPRARHYFIARVERIMDATRQLHAAIGNAPHRSSAATSAATRSRMREFSKTGPAIRQELHKLVDGLIDIHVVEMHQMALAIDRGWLDGPISADSARRDLDYFLGDCQRLIDALRDITAASTPTARTRRNGTAG